MSDAKHRLLIVQAQLDTGEQWDVHPGEVVTVPVKLTVRGVAEDVVDGEDGQASFVRQTVVAEVQSVDTTDLDD